MVAGQIFCPPQSCRPLIQCSMSSNVSTREKVIKVATPKQHPYASHISHFAMFPSFCSPDDSQTGFRASRRPFPNALVPKSAPDVTLISKTKGEEQQ